MMHRDAVFALLEARGIRYEWREHPAVYHMGALAGDALPHPEAIAKNLLLRDDKHAHYYLICLKGGKRLDVKAFRRAHNTRPLCFAQGEELETVLGLKPGSVGPFGALNAGDRALTVVLDAAFFAPPGIIAVHPNDNTATLWLASTDLHDLLLAQRVPVIVEDFA